MTDWHNSKLSFLGRPRQISLRLAKVVIHRLNFLLKLLAFSVMAEYEPEEIGTSERVHEGSRTGITPLQKATSGKRETEKQFLAHSLLVQAKTDKTTCQGLTRGNLYGSQI